MANKSDLSDKQKDKKIEVEEKVSREEVQEETSKEEGSEEIEEKEPELEKKEPTAEEKLAELQDRYLRLSAEYDNFRKRTLKEKIDLQKSANAFLLNALLPVADDFDRALQSVDDAKDIEAVKAGMELIYNKFTKYLDQQGVKEIEAVGKELNTDQHEAITKIPVEAKKQKGKIVDVVEKGYTLRDKVIRFAKVVIGE